MTDHHEQSYLGTDVVDEMLGACQSNLNDAQTRDAWFRKDPMPAAALLALGRDDLHVSPSTWYYDGGGCC